MAASDLLAPDWTTVCLNCRQPLTGRFCGGCGQRAVPPHPTVRQLAGDAWRELVGWDGRLARTLRALLRHPGELTRALLDGQRRRYISPVRLYLVCSVVYFVLAAAAPVPTDDTRFEISAGIGFTTGPGEETPGEAALRKAIGGGLSSLTAAERNALDEEISNRPPIFQPVLRAMAEDLRGLRRRIADTMPRLLFVLIPVLAAVLALFHRGRPYPDHLYFAIHLQTFVFITASLSILAQFSGSIILMAVAQVITGVWIVGYALVAQRRVYGGSWLASTFKTLGVGTLYLMLWGAFSIAAAIWASRAA